MSLEQRRVFQIRHPHGQHVIRELPYLLRRLSPFFGCSARPLMGHVDYGNQDLSFGRVLLVAVMRATEPRHTLYRIL